MKVKNVQSMTDASPNKNKILSVHRARKNVEIVFKRVLPCTSRYNSF